jgi:hypothetical protein
MYVVRLAHRVRSDEEPVDMWLVSSFPIRWGDRGKAMLFKSKGEARRAAASLSMTGAWVVEEA